MTQKSIRLRDGRALGYAEYGDPDGRPIFCFFSLSSRRFYPLDNAIAISLQARLITLERPGLGLSDPQPDRTLLDWPEDVSQAADLFQLDRFGVIGLQQGGPYAAACAFKLPDRITALGLVSASAPPDVSLDSNGLNLFNRVAALVTQVTAPRPPLTHDWIRQNPVKAWQQFHQRMPECDREMVREYGPRYLKPSFMRDIMDEIYRQGIEGALQDEAVLAAPWGFDPAQIQTPAYLWHGQADTSTPPAAGRYLARTLPNCQAHFLPAEGHWLYLKYWREILGEVVS